MQLMPQPSYTISSLDTPSDGTVLWCPWCMLQVVRTYIPFATSWDYTYPDVIWILSSLFRNGGAFNPRGLASRQDVGLEDYLREVKAQYPDR